VKLRLKGPNWTTFTSLLESRRTVGWLGSWAVGTNPWRDNIEIDSTVHGVDNKWGKLRVVREILEPVLLMDKMKGNKMNRMKGSKKKNQNERK